MKVELTARLCRGGGSGGSQSPHPWQPLVLGGASHGVTAAVAHLWHMPAAAVGAVPGEEQSGLGEGRRGFNDCI